MFQRFDLEPYIDLVLLVEGLPEGSPSKEALQPRERRLGSCHQVEPRFEVFLPVFSAPEPRGAAALFSKKILQSIPQQSARTRHSLPRLLPRGHRDRSRRAGAGDASLCPLIAFIP